MIETNCQRAAMRPACQRHRAAAARRLFSLVLSQTFRRRTAVLSRPRVCGAAREESLPGDVLLQSRGRRAAVRRVSGPSGARGCRLGGVSTVCGTVRRGADPVQDSEQAFALLASDKEGAAIALCADSAANEHARYASPEA